MFQSTMSKPGSVHLLDFAKNNICWEQSIASVITSNPSYSTCLIRFWTEASLIAYLHLIILTGDFVHRRVGINWVSDHITGEEMWLLNKSQNSASMLSIIDDGSWRVCSKARAFLDIHGCHKIHGNDHLNFSAKSTFLEENWGVWNASLRERKGREFFFFFC